MNTSQCYYQQIKLLIFSILLSIRCAFDAYFKLIRLFNVAHILPSIKTLSPCRDAIQVVFCASWHSVCSRDCWCLQPVDIHRKSLPCRVSDAPDRQDFVRNASRRIRNHFRGETMMWDSNSIAETNEQPLRWRITVNGKQNELEINRFLHHRQQE